jgi:hypothetical protein
MKNNLKKPLFVLITLLVILGIVYFIYPRQSSINTINKYVPPTKRLTPEEIKLSYISDEAILNSLQTILGRPGSKGFSAVKIVKETGGCFVKPTDEMGSFGLCDVARGDLNKDGYIDAVGIYTSCGASCGTQIAAVINNKDGTGTLHFLKADSIVTSGAGQTGVYRLYVIGDNIAVLGSGFKINDSQENSINYVKYRVDGDNLILIDSK